MHTPSQEFKEGKYDIGYVSPDLITLIGDAPFEEKALPTFVTLPRYMTFSEIKKEFNPQNCETGDLLAFLKNPPEGSKDGELNLFPLKECVVYVYWDANSEEWLVDAWIRGYEWGGGGRVFSPATQNSEPEALSSGTSDALTLERAIEVVKSAGLKVIKEM